VDSPNDTDASSRDFVATTFANNPADWPCNPDQRPSFVAATAAFELAGILSCCSTSGFSHGDQGKNIPDSWDWHTGSSLSWASSMRNFNLIAALSTN